LFKKHVLKFLSSKSREIYFPEKSESIKLELSKIREEKNITFLQKLTTNFGE